VDHTRVPPREHLGNCGHKARRESGPHESREDQERDDLDDASLHGAESPTHPARDQELDIVRKAARPTSKTQSRTPRGRCAERLRGARWCRSGRRDRFDLTSAMASGVATAPPESLVGRTVAPVDHRCAALRAYEIRAGHAPKCPCGRESPSCAVWPFRWKMVVRPVRSRKGPQLTAARTLMRPLGAAPHQEVVPERGLARCFHYGTARGRPPLLL